MAAAVVELDARPPGAYRLPPGGRDGILRRRGRALVRMLHELVPDLDLSITTNGLKLVAMAEELKAAGLRRVNVSLDTLQPERFKALARRDRFAEVIAGLDAARAAGFTPIKLNAVLMRGVNDDEVVPLARWARDEGYELRYIEWMPLDFQHSWDRSQLVPGDEILATAHEYPACMNNLRRTAAQARSSLPARGEKRPDRSMGPRPSGPASP